MNIVKTATAIVATFALAGFANAKSNMQIMGRKLHNGKFAFSAVKAGLRGDCVMVEPIGFANGTLNIDIYNDNQDDQAFQWDGQDGTSYQAAVYSAADIEAASQSGAPVCPDQLNVNFFASQYLQNATIISTWNFAVEQLNDDGSISVNTQIMSTYQTNNGSDFSFLDTTSTVTDTNTYTRWAGEYNAFMHLPLTTADGMDSFTGLVRVSGVIDMRTLPPLPVSSSSSSISSTSSSSLLKK